MPTKITKPPKKGKGAKYNRQKHKKSWKNNESVVSESPDSIGGKYNVNYGDMDAIPFGYYRGKFYLGKPRQSHGGMGDEDIEPEREFDNWREKLDYPGRIWINKKVISLWQYPPNTLLWKKLISDLASTTHKNIRKDFSIEMAKPFDKYFDRPNERIISVNGLMNKLEGKSGHKVKIPQHSKDTQNLQHLKSPMIKGIQNVPYGVGSRKRPAGMSASQYHQMIRTSEGNIKLGLLVKEIIRKRKENK